MKRVLIRSIFLGLALASSAAAQAISPTITSIPSRQAFAPGNVVVNGTFLTLITDVTINGVAYPIIRSSNDRIIAGPVPPQDPGFAPVVLSNASRNVGGTLELTPTLAASRKGQKVTAVINNGGAGTFVLAGNFRRLQTPVAEAGVYYGRLITANSPLLAAGVFTDAAPVATVSTKIPIQTGFIGSPFFVQARCSSNQETQLSFSNLASVPGLGQHQ